MLGLFSWNRGVDAAIDTFWHSLCLVCLISREKWRGVSANSFEWKRKSKEQNILTTGFWGKEAWRPTPKWNTYQVFLCIFQKDSAMATLGLKEFSQSSFGKCKKKSGIMKSGLDAMPLFLLDDLLRFCNVIVIVIVLVWLTFMSLYPIVDHKSDKKVNQTMTMTRV